MPCSEAFKETVKREREFVAGRLAGLRAQIEELRSLAEEDARVLRLMDEMLGMAPERPRVELRGRRLREVAVEVLRESGFVDVAIHYRDWYDLLLSKGFVVGGSDPIATFLTQITRASGVESVRRRSGLYRLSADGGWTTFDLITTAIMESPAAAVAG